MLFGVRGTGGWGECLLGGWTVNYCARACLKQARAARARLWDSTVSAVLPHKSLTAY